jgi:hypothetical protein
MRLPSASFFLLIAILSTPRPAAGELRAGAAAIDVTPIHFPVLVNGGMLANTATKANTPLYARAVVLDSGGERIAIVVVDSCMLPRPLLDEAKHLASQRTKIRPERMLISATHTHTAPSALACLGTDADESYTPYLREKLAEAIAAAESNLEPAKVGWAVKHAADYTALRRWIIRPDRVGTDPFGNATLRANMHAGADWNNVTGESGPEDPDLSMISFQALDGRPIALLANFSMHYFSGVEPLSADYFGLFCAGVEAKLGAGQSSNGRPFVAIMSHGCSGDIWRRDYTKPVSVEAEWKIDEYAQGLAKIALSAYESIDHAQNATIAMAERRMTLKYRTPDKQRLEWAQRIVSTMGDRPPKTTEEVYAREQIILHERQSTEIVVQALRIGEIAIATTPNETYALTGLKLKLQSPLPKTMVIELANGGDGYIPPPEQHLLGGYNTWAARSAGLEVSAEPKVVAAALELLEEVAGGPRRVHRQSSGPAADAIAAPKPVAWWRLDELAPSRALDSSSNGRDAFYEPGVVFFLEGPRSDAWCGGGEMNRCAHFAGGRLESRLRGIGANYSVALSFWNGMPADGRETSGWLFSRDHNHGLSSHGDHLGVGGTAQSPGKLIFQHGRSASAIGKTTIDRWTWNRLVYVREGEQVRVYLNGGSGPEIEVASPADFPPRFDQFFFGGKSDNDSNWEGRLDEIAVFDRALSADEAAALSQ